MDFVALIDLVKTVTKNKVKNIEVLGNSGTSVEDSLIETFYEAISKGRVTSDEEAVKFLYGKKETVKSSNYLRTRNRLIRQLINVSLFIDLNQPMFNERAKAYYNCYRDFASAHILTLRDAHLAAIDVFEQTLEQAIKYEFIELTADLTRELRKLYARISGDQTKHEKISQLHREYEEKRRLEMLALEHYENLLHYYIIKRSPNDEVHKYATTSFEELTTLAPKADTSQFYFYTYQIGIIKAFAVNDCKTALDTCNTCLEILQQRKNTNRAALGGLALQKIGCLTQLRIFNQECDQTVEYCLSILEEGHLNWFRTHELHLHYCLFAKRYNDALQIYDKVSKHPKFPTLAGAIRDNWNIYGGYLHLLAALGKLDAKKVTEIVGEYRYSIMITEIEVLTKDKEGMNIPLVLLPVVYALVNGTFEDFGVSPDALEKYRRRYLDTDLNKRSAAFVNLLFAYAKKDYRSASAEKKIKKELEVLASVQPQVAGSQTFAVEIIPYEDLWAMMMEK
ncbi:MAG: hypothetical protein JNJ57_05575 [Saprospiraceae bacterium]|nr:hypothetical protein [Saprospiraceae bacterium]